MIFGLERLNAYFHLAMTGLQGVEAAQQVFDAVSDAVSRGLETAEDVPTFVRIVNEDGFDVAVASLRNAQSERPAFAARYDAQIAAVEKLRALFVAKAKDAESVGHAMAALGSVLGFLRAPDSDPP